MSVFDTVRRASAIANRLFVVWVLLFSGIALLYPPAFTWIDPYITPLLGVIMLGMGMTLQPADLQRLLERPRDVAIGALTQWLVMPVAAYGLTVVLSVPPSLALGIVLVGAAPGGTASNVMTYLGDGDVALSVAITTVTTIAAPLVMPAWVIVLVGEQLSVTFAALFGSIVQVVLVPVIAGATLRYVLDRRAPELAAKSVDIFPLLSVAAIVAIVAAVVAMSKSTILTVGAVVLLAVVVHNAIGLGTGYGVGRLTGMSEDRARTCAFEVGLQNSGLAVALATAHFSPAVALPAALFSVWHNVTGPALASYFSSDRSRVSSPVTADD
ncbi:bile acid:sodium symporter family protein [Halocatena halophila]|uniref:bile acid:sodium symporter family protein n=1 Tax=Halocatena halophila TaxID=2814576 RepID=UPI002ED279F2